MLVFTIIWPINNRMRSSTASHISNVILCEELLGGMSTKSMSPFCVQLFLTPLMLKLNWPKRWYTVLSKNHNVKRVNAWFACSTFTYGILSCTQTTWPVYKTYSIKHIPVSNALKYKLEHSDERELRCKEDNTFPGY